MEEQRPQSTIAAYFSVLEDPRRYNRLVVDCTKVGFRHRMLTIGIAYRKRPLPLAWSIHRGSKGHITVQHQLALFQHVHRLLPPNSEVWVVGDAGFQPVPLLRWLARQHWPFDPTTRAYPGLSFGIWLAPDRRHGFV